MNTEKVYILLFGMHKQRYLFFHDVVAGKVNLKEFPNLTEATSSEYVIDRYNRGIHELIVSNVMKKKLGTIEEWKEFEKKWPSLLAEEHKYRPHWKRYWQCVQWNPKNQLLNIFKQVVSEKNLFVENEVLSYRNENKKKKDFLRHIERGCKNGIDIVIHYPNIKMYFVLDKLNMENIADKNRKKQYKGDFTCKELRYIFRHWYLLKEKVVFFENKKIVKAPWIEGKYVKDWQKYQEMRKRRLTGNLEKQRCQSMEEIQASISSTSERIGEQKNLQSLLIETVGKQKNIQEQKKPFVSRQRAMTI